MSLYDRIFKPHVYTLADGTAVEEKRSRAPLMLLVLIALTVLSVRITGFDLAVLVKKGSKFFDILKAMFPPNTAYLGKIWQPLWDTIKMSILGSFIGAVLAVPFAVAAASNIVTNRVVVFLVRLFLSLVRTLPTLVCALIATYIFGLGTMAGTCAIAVFTFAYVGKQLFEIIETVDMGPYEAMEALGATRLRAFTTAVFPQVLPTYLSVSLFCLEGNVRYASILGYVGAVISLPLSFLSASNLVPRGVALVGRVLIAAIRTIPAFVYGLMFIRVTGPGPFAGLLTMSLCSIGMVSKMFIESIEDLDKRILESLDAAGCTTFQKIRYGILPQLTADFTSTIIYRFDMNPRDATVLGLVGAGGIGAPLIFAMSSYRWNEVGAILLGLIVLVLIIEWISAKIRVKLARG